MGRLSPKHVSLGEGSASAAELGRARDADPHPPAAPSVSPWLGGVQGCGPGPKSAPGHGGPHLLQGAEGARPPEPSSRHARWQVPATILRLPGRPARASPCLTKSGETRGRELGWTVFFLSRDPAPRPSGDSRQGEVCSEGQPSPRLPVHTLRLPAPGRRGGGGAPRPHKKVLGTRGSDLPRENRSMAACPVLGLAALLCLSAPQVSSVVQYRQPVHVALLEPQGRDCSHIWVRSPRAPSGVYTIQPEGASAPFKVLCDMRPDGGWTVIQSRDRGRGTPLDFERCWQEYKQGFGDLRGDHWLGLEHISSLTSQPGLRSELSVDLLDADSRSLQAHYDDFRVGREEQFYPLTLGRYSGNAGDAFRGLGHTDNQEGCGFSTLDRDHDRCSPCVDGAQTFASCSHDRSGAGWWYSNCGRADLNGLWPEQAGAASGMRWAAGDHQPALRASLLRVHTTASGKA
ncbi:angiopoietin-4-like [Meles meles]|uniref:angiopoietin-4-like n=1 Tax=Meles meles TaxID=9662 RepID=UPI001E6993A5|nr:angiopoietin-4-like [Meles meles]